MSKTVALPPNIDDVVIDYFVTTLIRSVQIDPHNGDLPPHEQPFHNMDLVTNQESTKVTRSVLQHTTNPVKRMLVVTVRTECEHHDLT